MVDKFKILLVINTLAHGGGAETLVFNIYNELKKRNDIQVKLVSFQHSSIFKLQNLDYFEKQLENDSNFSILNDRIEFSFWKKNKIELSNFKRILDEFQPHIIHSHLYLAEIYSREFLLYNTKYFSHCHDNMSQLANISYSTFFNKVTCIQYFEKRRLVAKYRQSKTKFISISQDTTHYYTSVLPKSIAVSYLPNAIDCSKFYCSKTQLKQNDIISLVTVGSLVNKKNQAFLLPVIQILKSKGIQVKLHLLGDGANRSLLEKKIQDQNLSNNIFVHGNVENVQDFYWKSHMYVHSATYEPFGLVLIEAMAAGLPVVCLDGKGNRDLIEQGKNGYMVFEQNPQLFAEKIIEIWTNKQLYESMSSYAVEFAKQYDIVPYVDKLLEIYRGK